MCLTLLANCSSTVGKTLAKIEEESKAFEAQKTTCEPAIGPFNVFRLNKNGIPSVSNVDGSPSPRHNNTNDLIPTRVVPVDFEVTSFGDFGSSSPLDFLQWEDLFPCGANMFDLNPFLRPTTYEADWGALQATAQPLEFHGDEAIGPHEHYYDGKTLWPSIDLTHDVPFLLRHFNDHVIGQMGALPIYEKSTWRILNLASAVMTLSHLTILGTVKDKIKHATLANFYAVTAVSSFHLSLNLASFSATPQSAAHWENISKRTYTAAKFHVNLSLERESIAHGKAKYKDQLMAINATLATAASTDHLFHLNHALTIHLSGSLR
jgi:arginine metabolism regulation protein II